MSSWAVAFALTHAIEVPIYLALLRLGWTKRVCLAFGTSALTHPYVWFVWPALLVSPLGYWGYVAFAETFAVLVEAGMCVCFGVPLRRALTAALAANLSSFGLGLLILR
jgi:hypothetical protein